MIIGYYVPLHWCRYELVVLCYDDFSNKMTLHCNEYRGTKKYQEERSWKAEKEKYIYSQE